MVGKRDKPEEIVVKLRQVEVLQGQGMSVADAVRQIGVTQQTYYRWRRLYGGMGREQLRRLKELEKENQRLRRAVSDLTLDRGGQGKLLSPARRRRCVQSKRRHRIPPRLWGRCMLRRRRLLRSPRRQPRWLRRACWPPRAWPPKPMPMSKLWEAASRCRCF